MRKAPAVVFVEPNRVEVWDMAFSDPGPDEIGVRTTASGVSQGTERLALSGSYNRMGENIPAFYPCGPGYQAAGIIDATGENVTDLRAGDPVFVQGTRFADPSWKYPGPCLASHSGYLIAKRSAATPLPPGVDLDGASLYHMAAVAMHGARLTNIHAGDLVVVIGQGMIGQMAAQAARLRGARVISADTLGLRVDFSARCSADRAVHVPDEDLAAVVRAEAPGGADVVVDTTGSAQMVRQCVELVRREGTICLQGYYPDPVVFDFHATHLKRVTITFPCGWDNEEDTQLAGHLAAGRIQITPLITHRVPYTAAVEVYRSILEHPEQSLGVLLDWSGAA